MKRLTTKQREVLEEYVDLFKPTANQEASKPKDTTILPVGYNSQLYSHFCRKILNRGGYDNIDTRILNKWVTGLVKENRK